MSEIIIREYQDEMIYLYIFIKYSNVPADLQDSWYRPSAMKPRNAVTYPGNTSLLQVYDQEAIRSAISVRNGNGPRLRPEEQDPISG